jgi:phosphoglycolate phosphatase-like HAD superfamily hydrolase
MTVLFWDIDGTLLTTARAGVIAWEEAVRELTGREFDLSTIRTAGFTDYQIAVKTFEAIGLEPTPVAVEQFVKRYEELLPSSLPKRQGRVLDNVREILEHLERERPDVRSYLLTGNTRAGARAKLAYFDLMRFFPDGAFAEDVSARATIACRGLELARTLGPVAEDDVLVIGDTPHDIECARAIDARTIAVATGGYSLDELRTHGPWRAFATLPSPAEFVRLLEDAREPLHPTAHTTHGGDPGLHPTAHTTRGGDPGMGA